MIFDAHAAAFLFNLFFFFTACDQLSKTIFFDLNEFALFLLFNYLLFLFNHFHFDLELEGRAFIFAVRAHFYLTTTLFQNLLAYVQTHANAVRV